jgi:CubicO group peptidase (beta-lactamase class C family)
MSIKTFFLTGLLFAPLSLVLLGTSPVTAQQKSHPMSVRAIDSLVERSLKAFHVPGIAVAVIKDGKVVLTKGYGVRSLRTNAPVDEHTLFGIASNTKAFTATALGILVDEGKIHWDDKVRDYIPEFQLYDPYVTETFTIRDLLTHRSGLGLGAGDLMLWPDSNYFTLQDIIHNLRYLKPVSGFRAQYAYDNNLYILAGEVVHRVSGQTWEDFVEQRILQPLGMTQSAPCFEMLKDTSNIIDGHELVDDKLQVVGRDKLHASHPAGGINANVVDLSKWILMHLAGGEYPGGKLVSPDVHKELWTPQTIIPVNGPGLYNTHFMDYGLGFVLSDVMGYKQVTHNGGLAGMVTQITMIPELQLGIIVLTNQDDVGALNAITNQIKDGYLGIEGADRVSYYAQAEERAHRNADKVTDSVWAYIHARASAAPAEQNHFLGTYTDPWLGQATISQKNGKLWFDVKKSPDLSGELIWYKGNTFVARWSDRAMEADAFVLFSLDQDGNGAGFTMKPISPLTDFSYDFQDVNFSR